MSRRRKPITVSEAAAAMGRKGGKTTGPSKARQNTSVQIKAWWASPAADPYRAKNKTITETTTET
jgi:hypothetical protein